MENRSFDEKSENENPVQDNKIDSSGPSESQHPVGKFGGRGGLVKESSKQPQADASSKDDESPPAHVQRYMQKQKKVDLEDLEPPPPEPVHDACDSRSDPMFQQQARNRLARRTRQNSVEGPCSLRPDSPHLPALPEPEPYPDQHPANAPEQQSPPLTRPRTWRETWSSHYQRICTFSFQFPFHTLLLTWPLSTAIMGVINLHACRINPFFPFVMMAVGVLGTAVVLFRLYTLYFEKRVALQLIRTKNYWMILRITEFIVWKFFACQLYYFFKHNPSFTPGDQHFCKWRFYKINCGLMFLTSVTMIGWIIVHVAKFVLWLRRRNERVEA